MKSGKRNKPSHLEKGDGLFVHPERRSGEYVNRIFSYSKGPDAFTKNSFQTTEDQPIRPRNFGHSSPIFGHRCPVLSRNGLLLSFIVKCRGPEQGISLSRTNSASFIR